MNKIISFIKAKKYYVIIVFIILIFFIARTILLQKPNTELTYTVKQEDLIDTVQVSGTYKTASQVQVTSPANGVITKLFVSNGNYVKKGDPLFYVESTATVDQVKAAYAIYESATSSLQAAQQNKTGLQSQLEQDRQAVITASINVTAMQNNRNNGLVNPVTKLAYTQDDIDAINSALTSARETFTKDEQKYLQADTPIAAAQAQVAQTQLAYNETQSVAVVAPAAGMIGNLEAKIGDQVSAPPPTTTNSTLSIAQATQPSPTTPTVLVIANFGDQYISSSVSEDYASRIKTGQKASFVFDAFKEKTFTGSVQNIDTFGTTDGQGIVTYNARIAADNLTEDIKPDMTALITIETLRKNNVIDVPNSAIVIKNNTSYVMQAGSHKRIPIQTGIKGITKTEVLDGLSAGAVIVASAE